jgi:hypothetical protein
MTEKNKTRPPRLSVTWAIVLLFGFPIAVADSRILWALISRFDGDQLKGIVRGPDYVQTARFVFVTLIIAVVFATLACERVLRYYRGLLRQKRWPQGDR